MIQGQSLFVLRDGYDAMVLLLAQAKHRKEADANPQGKKKSSLCYRRATSGREHRAARATDTLPPTGRWLPALHVFALWDQEK